MTYIGLNWRQLDKWNLRGHNLIGRVLLKGTLWRYRVDGSATGWQWRIWTVAFSTATREWIMETSELSAWLLRVWSVRIRATQPTEQLEIKSKQNVADYTVQSSAVQAALPPYSVYLHVTHSNNLMVKLSRHIHGRSRYQTINSVTLVR
jgi:hypothetical protein